MGNVSKCKSILLLIDIHEQKPYQNGPSLLPRSTTNEISLAKNSHKQLMILYANPFQLFKRIFYLTNSCPQASDQTFSFFSLIDPTAQEL